MNYINKLMKIIIHLQKYEDYSVRNFLINYRKEQYHIVISVLDFGQRVEISKNDNEYLIFIKGIVGLNEEGIVHQKNSTDIINMINSINEENINDILEMNEKSGNDLKKKRCILEVTEKNNRKTKYNIKKQVDRLLDRYNDYLYLSSLTYFEKEKFEKKANKLLHLLKKTKIKNE